MEPTHWSCGSCGARFVDDAPSPRCPKCLKQSLVTRAEPMVARPVAHAAPAATTPEQHEAADRNAGRALAFATMPALLAAFLVSGWLGTRTDPPIALLLAIGAAPIAGFMAAKDWPGRIFASIASMIAAVGIVLATTGYIRGRSHLLNVELLLPMALGGAPGLALFYGFRALASVPTLRVVLAVGAIAVATVVVVSC